MSRMAFPLQLLHMAPRVPLPHIPPMVLEGRVGLEAAALLRDPVWYGTGVPHGHGEPVLLVPGFLAGDSSLVVMREWLQRIGYTPFLSGILMNVDCSDRALRRLDARLEDVHAAAGRPVTLIGHS